MIRSAAINRRDFLTILAAIGSLGVGHGARGQTPVNRAAVVIGVNKSGNLPVLNAAASGAHKVAEWLRSENFQVTELLDTQKRVTGSDVFAAVEQFLQLGTLEQLVVYFSGHGFLARSAEHWLLSDAPRNPNESINQRESVELARRTGVPNVVFISDACRSTPQSLGIGDLNGQLIFPASDSVGSVQVDVDQFFAALPGLPALELPVENSSTTFEGIYTAAFLAAYREPDSSMIKRIGELSVIPNYALKGYLRREVNRRAEAKSIRLSQHPESRVESGESIYIGRATVVPPGGIIGAHPFPRPPTPVTIGDVANASLASAGLNTIDVRPDPGNGQLSNLAASSGFDAVRAARLDASAPRPDVPHQFETKTGFLVYGTSIAQVTASKPEMMPEVLERAPAGTRPAFIRLRPVAGTLAIRFSDGSGTVVAVLPEYIGTLIVRQSGVEDLGYAPSTNGSRFAGDSEMRRVNELRASVATAAQYGVFHIDGDRSTRTRRAEELGDRIRMFKSVDPTLGLYAAYAYADAGLPQKIKSVREIMRGDLQFDVFDVAMLAGALTGNRWSINARLEPFCPLLSQGWNLLRVNRVGLPERIEGARAHLRTSLWTAFAAPGMDIIENYFLRRSP